MTVCRRRLPFLLLLQLLLLGDEYCCSALLGKAPRRSKNARLRRKRIAKRLLKPPLPLLPRPPPPPPLPLLLAPLVVAPALPAAGYLSVMGAPVYGQGLLPGAGGLVDFETLQPRVSTNEYLVAPSDACPAFPASPTGGGGGGPRRGPDAPVYDLPVDQLQRLFSEMVSDQYILKEYAQPTAASKPDERRLVFVQRTPLLRFPDVINVAFLALPAEEQQSPSPSPPSARTEEEGASSSSEEEEEEKEGKKEDERSEEEEEGKVEVVEAVGTDDSTSVESEEDAGADAEVASEDVLSSDDGGGAGSGGAVDDDDTTVDDFEQGRRSTLIIHSGSVYGFDDIGKNRERVTEWLQRLDDAVAASSR